MNIMSREKKVAKSISIKPSVYKTAERLADKADLTTSQYIENLIISAHTNPLKKNSP